MGNSIVRGVVYRSVLATVAAALAVTLAPAATAAGAGIASVLAGAGPRTEPFHGSGYATVRYVAERSGSDSADGTRAHPWRTPSHAIQAVKAGEHARVAILVAEGSYAGTTIEMRPFVDLLGGFDTASWTRDIWGHRTVLDGEDHRRVVVGADHARFDGFVVRNGRVRGQGAGILADGVSPSISNDVFEGNSTLAPANWKPAERHETANDGGAIAVVHGGAPLIAHNLFVHNGTEAGRGGGVACVRSSPHVEANVFLANETGTADPGRSSDGGAIAIFDHANPLVAGNVLVGNRTKASNDGGGIFAALWSAPVIRDNAIVGSWGDDDGGGLFIGGQQHHYSTPLDPIPPASEYLVKIDGNEIAGNDNSSHNAGVGRITMQARAELSSNVMFDNVGGLKVETSGALMTGDTLAGPLTISNTSKASHVLPGPVVLTGDVIGGPLDLEMAAQITHSCGHGLPAGSGNIAAAPEFVDDGLSGRISAVRAEPAYSSTLSVDGVRIEPGALAGRVIQIGKTWTLVKASTAKTIEVWGTVAAGESGFHVAPSYRVRPGSACATITARAGTRR